MRQTQKLIGCIDQSTTATKFIVFDFKGNQVEKSMVSHKQITPKSGWLEHDALEILNNTKTAINQTVEKIKQKGYTEESITSIGITNQRETVVAWNRNTGRPYHHAIVWNDQRTAEICERWTKMHEGNANVYSNINGLPINTYFSAFKIRWLIENIQELQEECPDDILYGNMNTWLLWNLTDRIHATDVSNASRTFLMNLQTLQYEQKILDEFKIDKLSLPEIRSCAEDYGKVTFGPLKGVPITSMLGDQQAASIGHGLFKEGGSKITYGSGCFLLANQGTEPQYKIESGLLTTLQYKFGNDKPYYAFEGAIETGALTLNWARDKIGLFKDFEDLDQQVASVKDNGGVYFVPTLSGAYSPYWNADATGMAIGMSFFTERGHILRALLESIAFRTKDVLDEVEKTNIKVEKLNVDGGVTTNQFLMQFQSNLIQKPLVKSKIMDSTCLGATLAAGLGSGVYKNIEEIQDLIEMESEIKHNQEYKKTADQIYGKWRKAVPKAFDWKK